MQIISNIYDNQYKIIAKTKVIESPNEYRVKNTPIKIQERNASASNTVSVYQKIKIRSDPALKITVYQI